MSALSFLIVYIKSPHCPIHSITPLPLSFPLLTWAPSLPLLPTSPTNHLLHCPQYVKKYTVPGVHTQTRTLRYRKQNIVLHVPINLKKGLNWVLPHYVQDLFF